MKKFSKPLAILGLATLVSLTGCAQGDTASAPDADEPEISPDAMRTAARFAVKRVVGAPARVALTAEGVAEKIIERKNSDDSSVEPSE